ncbi:MAG: hypothetical protein ABJH45_12985 [Paracoccaceae bacterium]
MQKIITLFFILFALPVFAQQERECRGKNFFDLGDGSYGCVFEVGDTVLTRTTVRDDGASTKSRRNRVGFIDTLVFGNYTASKLTAGNRMKAICKTFKADVDAFMKGQSYSTIIVRLVWLREKDSKANAADGQDRGIEQTAFTNSSCRGIRFIG